MQNIVCNAGQPVEARRIIEVPRKRHDAVRAQQWLPLAAVRQSVNAVALAQLPHCAQRHIAATDDQ